MASSDYNLAASVILDQLAYLTLISLPYLDGFFKNIFNSFEFNNLMIFHPEFLFLFKNIILNYYLNFSSNIYLSNLNLVVDESYLSPILMINQIFFIYFLVVFFLSSYFTYYNNYNSEDNIVDHDYLAYNVTIEAEEEIGSMDDMVLTSVILLYIFL